MFAWGVGERGLTQKLNDTVSQGTLKTQESNSVP